jgi:cell division protein FtsI/penicillin-binding protein 2
LLASEVIEHPLNLSKAAYLFGMGRKTGIDLPFEAPGLIPTDIDRNKTGLYTFAIGQHTLEVTPLQSAVMTAAIANKGVVVRPYIVQKLEGIERNLKYPCSEKDVSLGLSAADDSCVEKEQFVSIVTQPAVERRIDMPEPVFKELFEGMRLAVQGRRGTARPSAMRILYDHPTSIKDYIEVHKDLVSKVVSSDSASYYGALYLFCVYCLL